MNTWRLPGWERKIAIYVNVRWEWSWDRDGENYDDGHAKMNIMSILMVVLWWLRKRMKKQIKYARNTVDVRVSLLHWEIRWMCRWVWIQQWTTIVMMIIVTMMVRMMMMKINDADCTRSGSIGTGGRNGHWRNLHWIEPGVWEAGKNAVIAFLSFRIPPALPNPEIC